MLQRVSLFDLRKGRPLSADKRLFMWRDSLFSNSRAYDPLDRDEIAGNDIVGPLATNRFTSDGDRTGRYNIGCLADYHEVTRRGLDKHFDEMSWKTMRERWLVRMTERRKQIAQGEAGTT